MYTFFWLLGALDTFVSKYTHFSYNFVLLLQNYIKSHSCLVTGEITVQGYHVEPWFNHIDWNLSVLSRDSVHSTFFHSEDHLSVCIVDALGGPELTASRYIREVLQRLLPAISSITFAVHIHSHFSNGLILTS